MTDWLHTTITRAPETSLLLLFLRVGIALLLGVAVSGIYRWARRGEPIAGTFIVTLILLSTVIAMATQIIGDNIARAFSLVGALSVVRFRTVVKDTQDTAFVIFAVVVGMAAGTDHLAVGLVGLAVIGGSAFFLWPKPRGGNAPGVERVLALRISLTDGIRESAERIVLNSCLNLELISAATAQQGTALDVSYRVRLRPESSAATLVTQLNMIEGIESADLRRVNEK